MARYEETEKKPIYKKVWFWILIIILVVAIGASQGGNNNSTQTGTTGETQEKFTLQEGHKGTTDGYNYTIEGSIKNNTDSQYSYVQVTFNLYDKDGAQIGTALANINNLEANGLWKFKAIGLLSDGKSVSSYKLMEITGW